MKVRQQVRPSALAAAWLQWLILNFPASLLPTSLPACQPHELAASLVCGAFCDLIAWA